MDDWPAWKEGCERWSRERLSQVNPADVGQQPSAATLPDPTKGLWWVCGPRVSALQRLMVQMRLPDFYEYCDAPRGAAADTEPLDVFEMRIPESLQANYKVPPYFIDDLWDRIPDSIRPPWRWILLGPARSGTPFHIDPMGTSAWNACFEGRKRWALYPSGGWGAEGNNWSPPGVKTQQTAEGLQGEAPSAYEWWSHIYPTLPVEERPLEFYQEAGQVVFVPRGWWHAVVNETWMMALTQNFTNDNNLQESLQTLKESDPQLGEILALVAQR